MASNAQAVRIIATGFAALIVLMIALVIFGLVRLNEVYKTVNEIVTVEHVAIKSLYIMQGASRERAMLVHKIAQTEDPFDREELIQRFYDQASVFVQARQDMQALRRSEEEKSLLEKLYAGTSTTAPLLQQVVNLVQNGQLAEARRLLSEKALPAQTRVIQSVTQMLEYELSKSTKMADTARQKQQQGGWFMIASGAGVIVLSGLIALFVIRRLSDLVQNLVHTSGDLRIALRDLQFEKQALDEHSIVSITDADGNITYVNQKFIDASGYTREELLGQNHRLLKSDHHPPSFFEDLWETISSGHVWHGQICNRARNGTRYWVETTIVPFLDDAGLPYQYVSIRTEITPMKEAERMLQQSKEQLETMVQERTNELARTNSELQSEIDRRKQLEENLRSLAITDTLTGIHNRRKFDEALGSEMSRAGRYDTPLSLVMFDIDHFKQINDTRGHLVGDRILAALAAFVAEMIRSHDVFARYGGEEFVILAPNTDMNGCRKLAEKLRAAIERHAFTGIQHVTCSFGLADHKRGDTAAGFLRRADVALYRAKKNGRNRVEEE
ncbi:MAG: diguanylate cyclase [Gammaproteobacteria bacterium]|nr:diguanylate cyclase [Gammaproteobacteria bacterium]